MDRKILLFLWIVVNLCSCTGSHEKNTTDTDSTQLKGELVIFHAGSLSVPMKEISHAFIEENPEIHIRSEAAGSIESARKITELNKACDILASSDYKVIDKLLIPAHASWNIRFASNEMAIVYTEHSKRNQEINKDNWYKILLDKEVRIGRADPNQDPCGYRAVLVSKLAEKYYKQDGLAERLLRKDTKNIRPKEVDLLALLETSDIDYIFLYRSVAIQHQLKFLVLPDEINLKKSELTDWYSHVSVETAGKKPNETIIQVGEPMVYGITIPKSSPNPKLAMAFLKFMLSKDKGMKIMEKLGQPSVIPAPTNSYNYLPSELKPFALQAEK
jgi:molybdate/tungstate transport system substrate-binding protein